MRAGRHAGGGSTVRCRGGGTVAGRGGGAPALIAASEPNENGGNIALDATHVYWTDWGGAAGGIVRRVSKTGGAIEALITGLAEPLGVTVDASYVFTGDVDLEQYGKVLKAPKDGGLQKTLPTFDGEPFDLAIDATSVYWVVFQGRVMRVAK